MVLDKQIPTAIQKPLLMTFTANRDLFTVLSAGSIRANLKSYKELLVAILVATLPLIIIEGDLSKWLKAVVDWDDLWGTIFSRVFYTFTSEPLKFVFERFIAVKNSAKVLW